MIADKGIERRGKHPDLGRPFVAQQGENLVAVEGARHHDPPGGSERHERQVVPAHVGCRPAGQHDVIGTHIKTPSRTGNNPTQRLKAVANSLRLAGATGGKEDDRWVLRLRWREVAGRFAFRQPPETWLVLSPIVVITDPAQR